MKILVCFQDFITNTFTYTLHTNGFFIYFLKHLILVLRASKHKLNFLASSSCWHLDLHFHHVFTRYNQLLSSCIMNFLLLGKHLVFLFTLIFEKKKKNLVRQPHPLSPLITAIFWLLEGNHSHSYQLLLLLQRIVSLCT